MNTDTAATEETLGRRTLSWSATTLAVQLAVLVAVYGYYGSLWGSFQTFGAEFASACAVLFCDFTRHFFPTAAEIFRSAIPFLGLQALALFFCVTFPEIVLYLPRLIYGQ